MSTAVILCDGCGAIFVPSDHHDADERRRMAALVGWSTGTCGDYDWCMQCTTDRHLATVKALA